MNFVGRIPSLLSTFSLTSCKHYCGACLSFNHLCTVDWDGKWWYQARRRCNNCCNYKITALEGLIPCFWKEMEMLLLQHKKGAIFYNYMHPKVFRKNVLWNICWLFLFKHQIQSQFHDSHSFCYKLFASLRLSCLVED